ncbi:chaperonin CPN60-1, mitochondrial-like isoform X3 [Actinidia eriantha]|uniref:chaperonin CPN60-1, mitochondrial-like isoform X3 n=1 Tax=Actinidia eriantha TaxID=165200 RepID=UPI002587C5D5|nr:chaperonin CPN60-1, mitochondrial-like isoform X3 [Actinidia eriantha]
MGPKRQKYLLIVSEDVESEELRTLILSKLRAGIKVCIIKAPGFGENRKANLQDLAVLTRSAAPVHTTVSNAGVEKEAPAMGAGVPWTIGVNIFVPNPSIVF